MTFAEKLKRLLRDMNISAVARRSCTSATAVHNYLNGSIPGIDIALRLARVLGVDPGWLIDDSKDWPPVRIDSSDAKDHHKKAA